MKKGNFMKMLTFILLFGSLAAQATVGADLVNCEMTDTINLTSRLRIFQTAEGYAYEASTCKGLAHATCLPYEGRGPILRRVGELTVGTDFLSKNYAAEGIGFLHLFGEYDFSDKNIHISFPDEACRFSAGKKTDIVVRGELGQGLLGACSEPSQIWYVGMAKARADIVASSRCSPLQANRISDYEVFSECLNDFNTTVARAIYRCE